MDLLSFKTAQVFLFFMSYSDIDEITVSVPKLSGKLKIVFLCLL
jgi:hypothetical protein